MSDSIIDAAVVHDPVPAIVDKKGPLSRLFGCIELWLVLSLLFILLMRLTQPTDGASWLWPIDPLLTFVYMALMAISRRWNWKARMRLSRAGAALLFCVVSWANSMLYEGTLSHAPGKYGGMHNGEETTTVGSFIIAQGFYLPLMVLGLWLVSKYHVTFRDLFFVAGMTSIYEAVTVGLPSMISPPFFLSPVIIAYYFVVYSRFLSMGLLVVDERLLWSSRGYAISFPKKLMLGSALGIVCWICFVAWGELAIYLFDNFQGYP